MKNSSGLSRVQMLLLICVFAIGVLSMQLYLLGIRFYETQIYPISVFWVGAALISFSLVYLWHRQAKVSIILPLIFLTALAVLLIPTSRFSTIAGSDLIGEYYVAQKTKATGWPPELPLDDTSTVAYAGSLGVTILPTIVSGVTGVDVLGVFQFFLPFISAFLPVMLFLVIREAFNSRIATISAIIFLFNPNFPVLHPYLMKVNLALMAFTLSVFCVLKEKRRFTFLALVLVFTISAFHHTTTYFAMVIFLAFLLSPKILSLLQRFSTRKHLGFLLPSVLNHKRVITTTLLLFSAVTMFTWFTLSAPSLMIRQLKDVPRIMDALLGITPAYSISVGYVVASPRGYFHTLAGNLTKILVVLGFFIALRTSRNKKSFALTLAGGSTFILLIVWVTLPGISLSLFVERLYLYGFIFFSTFIALSLTKICSRMRRLNLLGMVFLITMIFVESLTMPAIFLHPEKALDPQESLTIFSRGPPEVMLGLWMKQHINKTGAIISEYIRIDMRYFSEINFQGKLADLLNQTDVSTLNGREVEYVMASSWLIRDGYVSYRQASAERIVLKMSEEEVQVLFSPSFDYIYCDANNYVFYYYQR